MMIKPPVVIPALTPCEAKTRSGRPLGGFLGLLLLQERKLRLAHNPRTGTRMRFFTLLFMLLCMLFCKRRAPNDMKKEDLIAKWWIITDPGPDFMLGSSGSNSGRLRFFCSSSQVHGDARISSHP